MHRSVRAFVLDRESGVGNKVTETQKLAPKPNTCNSSPQQTLPEGHPSLRVEDVA